MAEDGAMPTLTKNEAGRKKPKVKKYYFWYCEGKKKILTISQGIRKKEQITKHAKALTTIEAVLAYCTQNFVQGPFEKRLVDLLCADTSF